MLRMNQKGGYIVNIVFDFVSDSNICTTVEEITRALNTELAARGDTEKFEYSL